MNKNFRLAYNTGKEYTELMPETKIEAIENVDRILSYETITLSIPAFTGLKQVIAKPLTDAQANAPVFVVQLVTAGNEALRAYGSIDQIESTKDGFVITRLNKKSLVPIDVKITFKEVGVHGF